MCFQSVYLGVQSVVKCGQTRDRENSLPTRPAPMEYVCEDCGHVCNQCKRMKTAADFAEHFSVNRRSAEEWRCLSCQYPSCVKCGQTRDREISFPTRQAPMEYVCEDCPHVCNQCKQMKTTAEFAQYFSTHHRRTGEWRCLACQYPSCLQCGQPRDRKKVGPTRQSPQDYTCEACSDISLQASHV